MNSDDANLLAAYVHRKDAEAFAALVERYELLVYTTSLRQLGNTADAEEVSQDVFLALAKHAGKIVSGNLGGWLHRTAINAATTKLRSDLARTQRERTRPAPGVSPKTLAEWHRIEEVLDTCLDELDSDNRELVIQRFFAQRSQSELAESLGVDQATISRKLKKSIEQLRRLMVERGVSLTTAALAAAFAEHAASGNVPPTLSASLKKIGLAGVGEPTRIASMGRWPSLSWTTVGAAIATLVAISTVLIGAFSSRRTPAVVTLASPPQFGVVAGLTRLDYSTSLSSSGLAIDDNNRIAFFNDIPAERAGVYVFQIGSPPQLHRLPPHRRRSLAFGPNAIVAASYDGQVGVVDRQGLHAVSKSAAVEAPPSMNRSGSMVFIESEPISRIRLAAGDGVRTIHESGDQFARFDEAYVNDSAVVAFRAATTSGHVGLFVSQAGELSTIAQTGETYQEFRPWFDFNNRGQIAVVAKRADGNEAILVGDAKGVKQIVETGEYFSSFLQASLNDAGMVAFTARRPGEPSDLPVAGLYLWDGQQVVELLRRGQQLNYQTLEGVVLWRDSLNNAGQIATVADFGPREDSAILRLETSDLKLASD
jgi:RNA polymerase sigma factor (sigma-70 family)